MRLIHADCPAKPSEEWRSPEFREQNKKGEFVTRYECPLCKKFIVVTVLRDCTVYHPSAEDLDAVAEEQNICEKTKRSA